MPEGQHVPNGQKVPGDRVSRSVPRNLAPPGCRPGYRTAVYVPKDLVSAFRLAKVSDGVLVVLVQGKAVFDLRTRDFETVPEAEAREAAGGREAAEDREAAGAQELADGQGSAESRDTGGRAAADDWEAAESQEAAGRYEAADG